MTRRTVGTLLLAMTCLAATAAVSGCSSTTMAVPPATIATGHLVAPAAAPPGTPAAIAAAAEPPAAAGQRPNLAPGTILAFDERTLRTLPHPAEGRMVADVVSVDAARHQYTLRVVSFGLRMRISTTQPGVALTLPAGSLLRATIAAPTAQAGKTPAGVDITVLRVGAHVSLMMRAGARAGSPYVEIVSVAPAPAGATAGGTGK